MDPIAVTFSSRQETSNDTLLAVAKQADSLGYHSFWTGESWGRDAFTVLTMIGCHTKNIRLGTGIVPVFSRTPGLIAQSIASLDIISQGRAILGLGTSGRVVIEDWHGVPYRQPLLQTREYIEIIRQALSGGRVNHDGRFFHLQRFAMGIAPIQQQVPIYLASIGPRNLELTGELADGWLPIWVDLQQLPNLVETVAGAASASGRDISQITVAPQMLCYAVESQEEMAEAERLMRSHMVYYIAGMGEYYYNLFCRYGYQSEADQVREAWRQRDRDGASSGISDRMLENITVFGDASTCRAKLEQFRRNGVNMPVIAFPHGATDTAILRTLKALAPETTEGGSG
jgi:F420-dependent oxidoreductase-like protein